MQQGYVLLSRTGEIHVCDLEWVVKGFARLSEFVVFNWGSTKPAGLTYISIYGSFHARCH